MYKLNDNDFYKIASYLSSTEETVSKLDRDFVDASYNQGFVMGIIYSKAIQINKDSLAFRHTVDNPDYDPDQLMTASDWYHDYTEQLGSVDHTIAALLQPVYSRHRLSDERLITELGAEYANELIRILNLDLGKLTRDEYKELSLNDRLYILGGLLLKLFENYLGLPGSTTMTVDGLLTQSEQYVQIVSSIGIETDTEQVLIDDIIKRIHLIRTQLENQNG